MEAQAARLPGKQSTEYIYPKERHVTGLVVVPCPCYREGTGHPAVLDKSSGKSKVRS